MRGVGEEIDVVNGVLGGETEAVVVVLNRQYF